MTDYELHGPWTGNALHAPAIPESTLRIRRRIRVIFAVLTVLVIVGDALTGLSHT